MGNIKELIENNKKASILAILTLCAFLIGLLFCLFNKLDNKPIEKKKLEEHSYVMYFKEQSIVKINFKEFFYKCGANICSDYTHKVTSFELINDQDKTTYSNINIKNKDLVDSIAVLITESTNKGMPIKGFELISNWNFHYTDTQLKELLKKKIENSNDLLISFEYSDNINEENLINNVAKKLYTISFDSNLGSTIDPQTVIENEKAIEPPIPTREGYEFIRWQFNSRPFNFDTQITKDYTLRASWKKKPTVSTVPPTEKRTTTKVIETESDIENETTKPTVPENKPEEETTDTPNEN